MGGAERNARKKRQQQQAARAITQARGGGDTKKIIAIVAGVVVLAALVIGGVLWTNASKNKTEGQDIPTAGLTAPGPGVVEKRDGVVVTVGKPGATKTIDIYADFLCPACGNFEKLYGEQIHQQVNDGKLQVKYHMLPMLNRASSPPGYSVESANAALAAADAGKFSLFHDALFRAQPEEGKRGYDKAQLIKLGQDLGITGPEFGNAVTVGTYSAQITSEFDKTADNQQLWHPGAQGFQTPTVVRDGKVVDVKPGWLGQ
ncbi:Thioredoxin [Amycolatopsis xylanica]|uniref:Thioredoxin n=1 Tax=Amycolatopsis xylanica TaxID=589385 RepID=A0A1H3PNN0_9PSEU|nr:thioredoxin domain-containing protein [Amycolatopsis xylanica]SDZ02560.1 Thioredoxin [Amycolatopsis xylanica]